MMHSGRELFDKSKKNCEEKTYLPLVMVCPMSRLSSIVPKLVPAVTIVMPSSDGTRNPMQCDFFSAEQNLFYHLGTQ